MHDFSVYVLSPDRRFVTGSDSFTEAVSLARQNVHRTTDSRGQKIESCEVWDNNKQQPAYGVERHWGGKLDERFADGYSVPAPAERVWGA